MRRRWLDWQQPLLPAAAAWIVQEYAVGERCDLRGLRCVVPGGRAGRLLLRELIRCCTTRALRLIPPQVMTPGALVEAVIPPTTATASELECSLAWMHVLRDADPRLLEPLIPRPPERYDWPAWHELALQIGRITEELAGELRSFGEVARAAIALGSDREADRWQVLAQLYGHYRDRLREAERIDPHERRAQAHADLEIADDETLVLIGVVDLNQVQRSIVAAYGSRAELLIHAPEELAAGFDPYGCVELEFWAERRIAIADDRIVLCDRPTDQAQAVIEQISDFAGAFSPEEITIGLGDEALGEPMAQAGEWASLVLHDPRGKPVHRLRPFRLLAMGIEWLRERRFANLAALIRHPDVERWVETATADFLMNEAAEEAAEEAGILLEENSEILLEENAELAVVAELGEGEEAANGEQGAAAGSVADHRGKKVWVDWLSLLDKYYADHLSDGAAGPWLGKPRTQRRLQALQGAIEALFEPLTGPRRPLTEWFEPLLEVLRRAYGEIETQTKNLSEHRAAAACLEIARALGSFTSAAAGLQPEVDGMTAVRLVLAQAAGLRIADEPRSGQIEMLGWLELHHDPAPALVIAGFNDGAIPQAVVADAYLPDGLRAALGLLCNRRRYARDAYLLEAIRRSRSHCIFVAGRAAADGEPLIPSRLLLADAREALPARILLLCDHERARRWALPRGAPPAGSLSRFTVPEVPEAPPSREKMSVTEFGWYLRCPYRYYLKYVRRLRVVEDAGVELSAIQFGNIAHEVLQGFGEDPSIAISTDPEQIAAYLDDALDREARKAFGRRPLPAIRIQLARLRARLHAFSRHQARHRADGWVIDRCEWELPTESFLAIPGQEPIQITGKVDRIDRNPRSGDWMIIDYKTSESGKPPEKTHQSPRRANGERTWEDLQLPLYHHLVGQHGFDGEIRLAYMNLPKKPDDAAVHVARWSERDLAEAIDVARGIVREIRAGNFAMADNYPGHFQDDFANICQTGVFGGGDEEGLGAEAEG